MIPLFFRNRLFPFYMLIGILLSGCISTNYTDTKLYILSSLDSGVSLVTPSEQKDLLQVEVISLRLPPYLERPQIVTLPSENRLKLDEFNQWGENLRKNMIRVIGKNLSQLLATPNIIIPPNRPLTSSDFRIILDVMQFERAYDDKVHLSVQWSLLCGKAGNSLTTQITDLSSMEIKTGSDFERTVSAMSTLIGELTKIISKEIIKYKSGEA